MSKLDEIISKANTQNLGFQIPERPKIKKGQGQPKKTIIPKVGSVFMSLTEEEIDTIDISEVRSLDEQRMI